MGGLNLPPPPPRSATEVRNVRDSLHTVACGAMNYKYECDIENAPWGVGLYRKILCIDRHLGGRATPIFFTMLYIPDMVFISLCLSFLYLHHYNQVLNNF